MSLGPGKVELRLPSRDGGEEYATLQAWLKKVGDPVGRGEPVVEVDTDKVTEEVVSPVAGTLVEIIAYEGDEIKVESVLAIIEVGEQ
jgi:2-oxoglutarate dehydrogenase E2 component (dihydrolipoamide succinyltransferase)